MSERDTVHKEIEKLQEEVSVTKKKMTVTEAKAKGQEEDVSTRKIIQWDSYTHIYVLS